MKFFLTALVLFAVVSGFSTASSGIHETQPAETVTAMPGAEAKALYNYITSISPYKRWSLWPGKGRLYKGREPHGALLTTYVNETALSGTKVGTVMKDGAIIVKENYSGKKEMVALTVMYKIKGYNPEDGDWFWARYSPGGSVEVSGKAKACIDCHGVQKDNDYVFSGKVAE